MIPTHSLIARASLAVLASFATGSQTDAAVQTWNAGTADFNTGSNWTPGFVGAWPAGDIAEISNGGTATMSAGSASLSAINVGQGGVDTATGTLSQSGGSISLSDGLVVGRQGTASGVYTMAGGSLSLVNLRLGGGTTTSQGTMSVSGAGTAVTSSGTGHTSVGSPGTGTLTLSDSATWTHNGGNAFLVGSDNNLTNAVGGTGTLNVLSGARLDLAGAANLSIGRSNGTGGNGTLVVDGGSVSVATGNLNMSSTNNGAGNPGGTGTVTLTSGSISAALLNMNEGTSTVNLDGGTLTVDGIVKLGAAGSGTVNFNGVTVVARSTNTNFIQISGAGTGTLALNIQAGGLVVDTNGHAIGVGRALDGAGGIVKQGSGVLTLSGANTFTGGAIIDAGTLALGADDVLANASELTLNSGTLDLAGFSDMVGALTLLATSTLDFGSISGVNGIVFANSSALEWSGNLILTNFEVGSDILSFSDVAGLTLAQLGAIQLAGYTATGLDDNGIVEFAAVPEPVHVAVAVAGLLTLVGVRRRFASARM